MIVLLDTGPTGWASAAQDLGDVEAGQLLTPLTSYAYRGGRYGIDNGAFARFDPVAFLALLGRLRPHRESCLFVAAPDVVGSARRTAEAFKHWYPRLEQWPVALVAQDGIEDLDIPWNLLSAVFIGGSTRWKLSEEAAAVSRCAKVCGKWLHVGRVNTPGRFDRFDALGADSCDGTGLSRYSHMRRAVAEGFPLLDGTTGDNERSQ